MAPLQEEADNAGFPSRVSEPQGCNEMIAIQEVLDGERPETKQSASEGALSVKGPAAMEQTSSSMATAVREAQDDAIELEKALETSRQLKKQIEDMHASFEARLQEAINQIIQHYDQQFKTECKKYRNTVVESGKLSLEKRILAAKADLDSSDSTRCKKLEEEIAQLKSLVNNLFQSLLRKKDAQNTKTQNRRNMNLKESFRQQSQKQLEEAEDALNRQHDANLEQQITYIDDKDEKNFQFQYNLDCFNFDYESEDRELEQTNAILNWLRAQPMDVSDMEEVQMEECQIRKLLMERLSNERAQELVNQAVYHAWLQGNLAHQIHGAVAFE